MVRAWMGEPGAVENAVADAWALAWATEGAVCAMDTAAELWWLGLAESVVYRSMEGAGLPRPIPVRLGLGRAPGFWLVDTPDLRDAARGLIAAASTVMRAVSGPVPKRGLGSCSLL